MYSYLFTPITILWKYFPFWLMYINLSIKGKFYHSTDWNVENTVLFSLIPLILALGKRSSNKKKYPSPDKNRVVSLPGAKDVTPIKGSLIQGHRYLDAEGNIRIRTIPKYLAQTGRGPSYIYRPPRTRLHSQRPTRLNDRESQGRGAVRGVPAQGARGNVVCHVVVS